jgi:exopolysaccharide biosynthesis WecB/TagA/CpsF family protein
MQLLGVRYDNLTRQDALEKVLALLSGSRQAVVFFLNLDCLKKATEDPSYASILSRADLVLPDGVGLRAATALCGAHMKDNCNGSDFSPVLLREAAQRGHTIFFIGGASGVAQEARIALQRSIPGIQIVGALDGFFTEDAPVIEAINASGAEILFVGMGVPMQEKWIEEHKEGLRVKLLLGVGALFDWLSGTKRRAPVFIRRLYLEWLWRIFIEPGRLFKRYIIDDAGFLLCLVFRRSKRSR